jgi:hypothetical protein
MDSAWYKDTAIRTMMATESSSESGGVTVLILRDYS